jgi:CDP-glucose 4,6-dehydratase
MPNCSSTSQAIDKTIIFRCSMKAVDLQNIVNQFKGKRVLITGNTGFKGTWLSLLLQRFDADLYGFSNQISSKCIDNISQNSLLKIQQYHGDISKPEDINRIMLETQPEFIFHLAANAITLSSYSKPIETFLTNAMGTAYLLEAARKHLKSTSIIIISSDKSYQNNNLHRGYIETDPLGGTDPYSASKSMAEIITSTYYHSFFKEDPNIQVASCRAGNVFGGGDWGENRIIPDAIRAWKRKKPLLVRNPLHTRPWNYVLDVIWGYILCAYHLDKHKINGESFNFGPSENECINVETLVEKLWAFWPDKSFNPIEYNNIVLANKEHPVLMLNSDKAKALLQWKPIYDLNEAIKETVTWYFDKELNATIPGYASDLIIESYLRNFK